MTVEEGVAHAAYSLDFHFYAAIAVFVLVYAMLVWEKVNRAIVAMTGAGFVVLLGVQTQEKAIHGIDFNTIGLLVGMMAIVSVSQKTGMFQYLAIKSAKAVKGDPWRMLVALSVVTAVLSAFLDNVTTVLLIVPLTLLITDEMKLPSYPFLVSQILASNIGGAATLIGDPPNIMIGSSVNLTFLDFLINVAPLMPIVFIATLIPLKLIYGRSLTVTGEAKARIMRFNEGEALKDIPLLKKSLLILGIVIIGFILQEHLHLHPATIAMTGAVVLMLISGEDFDGVMAHVEWTTIFFFIGLFILVHGLVEVQLISMLAGGMLNLTGGDIQVASYVILWVSAVASALVDNIPFVATMIPLIQDLAPSFGGEEAIRPLWWALSIGACLGGNGSIIGASANVIVAGFAHRAGQPIMFLKFMLIAFPLMIMSIIISTFFMMLYHL